MNELAVREENVLAISGETEELIRASVSEKTLRAYRRALKDLDAWLGNHGLNDAVPAWSTSRNFTERRNRPPLSPKSLPRFFGSLFSTAGRGVKVIFAENRTKSHPHHGAKIMHETKLQHAWAPFSSRNA